MLFFDSSALVKRYADEHIINLPFDSETADTATARS